jgi:tetratricopeptide (TPR) repeat protein
VQSDVAEQIASALQAQIKPAEEQSIKRQPTQNMAAFESNLQGRVYLGRRTEDQLRQAIAAFERAIDQDSNYARAYTGLADAYIAMSLFEYLPSREAFPKAMDAAERALKIDPTLADAHASLGLAKFQYSWDWERAEAELTSAIKLNPNYAPAHHFFADYLKGMGRFDEALEQIRIAQSLDPLSLPIAAGVGHVLYLSRQYDAAIEAYKSALMLDPRAVLTRLWFGRPYLQKGMYEEAVGEIQQAVELSRRSTITLAVLGHAQAAAGNGSEADEILKTLQDRSRETYVPSYWIAFIYVGRAEKDKALEWLEKAFEERSAWLAWVNVEPRFDPLREERRFNDLLNRIGFPSA